MVQRRLHVASIAVLAGAAALLFSVQFVPWATTEHSGTTPDMDMGPAAMPATSYSLEFTSFTWWLDSSAQSGGSVGSDSIGWYDGDLDGADGVATIRAAVPLLLAGLVAAVAGAVLNALRFGNAAGALGVTAGLLSLAALILFAAGTSALYDGVGGPTWHVGFYFAILGVAAALVGGVFAMAPWDDPAPTEAVAS